MDKSGLKPTKLRAVTLDEQKQPLALPRQIDWKESLRKTLRKPQFWFGATILTDGDLVLGVQLSADFDRILDCLSALQTVEPSRQPICGAG